MGSQLSEKVSWSAGKCALRLSTALFSPFQAQDQFYEYDTTTLNFTVLTLTCAQSHRVVWHPQRLLPFPSGALPSTARVWQHLLQPAA